MDTELVDMLRRNHLNITTARLNILLLFYNKTTCLSHEDILKRLGNRIDRVTVYRTLRIFVKKEILYCIPTANNFTGVQLIEVPRNFIIRQCAIVMNGKCNNCH